MYSWRNSKCNLQKTTRSFKYGNTFKGSLYLQSSTTSIEVFTEVEKEYLKDLGLYN